MYKHGLGMSRACFSCNQADSLAEINLPHTYISLSGHKKLDKPEMVLKVCNFKKWNRDRK